MTRRKRSNVIGFYTRSHKTRPVTPKSPRRRGFRPFPLTKNIVVKDLSRTVLQQATLSVAGNSPALIEIVCAVRLAAQLYEHWDLIMELCNDLQEPDQGRAIEIAAKPMGRLLDQAIVGGIGSGMGPQSKQLLSTIINQITEKEIEFVAEQL